MPKKHYNSPVTNPKPTPDLSIIIVTYNSEKYILTLLDSIKKSPDKLKKEIIIIDNASPDNSISAVENHPLKPTVIISKVNRGFSHAVNLGLKQARGKYLLLLNPDTQIIGQALSKLVSFAETHKPLGAVAPHLINPNNHSQPSALYFPNIFNAIRAFFLNQKKYFNKYLPDRTGPVEAAVMAAFLIPRTTIDTVGLLDERFFLYYEDIEYCRRLKQARLPVYYLSTAKIKHVHGASGNFKDHLNSPLAKSAQIYHGKLYSQILNGFLLVGQKYQKFLSKFFHKA
jgi:GT2 family glycosyltransferase